MEEGQYKGVVAYLKNHKIADVPRNVWLARRWRFTKNGRKNSDAEAQKRFKKFASLHYVKGFGFVLFFFLVFRPLRLSYSLVAVPQKAFSCAMSVLCFEQRRWMKCGANGTCPMLMGATQVFGP